MRGEKLTKERMAVNARVYNTNKAMGEAMGIDPGVAARACKRFGIETPEDRRRREGAEEKARSAVYKKILTPTPAAAAALKDMGVELLDDEEELTEGQFMLDGEFIEYEDPEAPEYPEHLGPNRRHAMLAGDLAERRTEWEK